MQELKDLPTQLRPQLVQTILTDFISEGWFFLFNSTESKINKKAMTIGSISQINLTMEDRETVTNLINKGECDPDIFVEIENHVIHLLRYSIMPLWMSSQGYTNALKKLNVDGIRELAATQQSPLLAQANSTYELLPRATSRSDGISDDVPSGA